MKGRWVNTSHLLFNHLFNCMVHLVMLLNVKPVTFKSKTLAHCLKWPTEAASRSAARFCVNNIELKEKFVFCTLTLTIRTFMIIYNVLQHYYDKHHSPESWGSGTETVVCFVKQLKQFSFVFSCQYMRRQHLTFSEFHVFWNKHLLYFWTDSQCACSSVVFS